MIKNISVSWKNRSLTCAAIIACSVLFTACGTSSSTAQKESSLPSHASASTSSSPSASGNHPREKTASAPSQATETATAAPQPGYITDSTEQALTVPDNSSDKYIADQNNNTGDYVEPSEKKEEETLRSQNPEEETTSSDISVATPVHTAPTTPPRREGNDARHALGTQEKILSYTYRVTGEHELTFEVQPSDRTCTDLRWVFSEENGVFSIAFIEGVRADGSDVCTSQGWVSTVHFETSAPAHSLKVQPLSTNEAQLNR